jgi:hypothetical protein
MKLIAPSNRVIVKVDLESKNSHTFKDGTKIRLERVYDNFNMRYVKPVNAIVVNAKNIPEGSEILIHHNSTHDTYRIFNYKSFTEDASSDIKYYSIPMEECFLWRKKSKDSWKPLNNFITALRIFQPYTGFLEGITPSVIKDKLYITSGELKGNVCEVLKATDYQIIFQGDDGVEESIIRLRHFEDGYNDREEVIAINHELTDMVITGQLLVGITPADATKLITLSTQEICL